MQHRQIVLLICGLMSDPSPIIHLVYECWINEGQKSTGKTVIEAMFREAGLPVPKDLLHNEWINYYDHEKGLIKDTTPVYVPSRWYKFHNIKANISCNIQHRNTEIPECTMIISRPNETVRKNLLSICHRIFQHQTVRNLYLCGVNCEDLQEPHVFNISKNAEGLTISFQKLSKQILSHWMQQINLCGALRVLDLRCTTVTDCLSGFLPDPHPGLPELRELCLSSTSLNKEDLCHLLSIAYKLPALRILDLSRNTLTGCLSSCLPDPHPGLPELRELNLERTSLNKEDLQHISNITQSNKLPKLRILDLSHNTLTGCLSSVLPDNPHGLPELQKLNLGFTKLNKDDLHLLTHLIQTHKMAGLEELNLEFNKFYDMEADVEHLIEACVTHHQRELRLKVWCNRLSVEFREKWRRRCARSKIKLHF